MMKKIHKIPDKIFFKAIFLIVIIWNLKYFFLPIQVPFTLITQDFITKNNFHSTIESVRNNIEEIKSFHDEGKIGFTSDVPQSNVFDIPDSIYSFYVIQYAVIPSILKNDTDENYIIGSYFKKIDLPEGFTISKKINEHLYILKKDNK